MFVEVEVAANQNGSSADMSTTQAEEMTDPFERLHDSEVLQILNKVGDVKSLGRCRIVSKRFLFLVSYVQDITVKVDCVISGEKGSQKVEGSGVLRHFVRFVVSSIFKPLQLIQHMLGHRNMKLAEFLHHSPGEVLKNFRTIRNLKIELPGGELGVENGALLMWKADFGSTLDSC
eukprot:c12734_g1_i1 orf=3-524(-)